jgi:hypothetical protein
MSKEIREIPYHLYLGCEVSVTNIEGRYTTIIDYDFFQRFYDEDDNRFMNDPKPILRKLSSMTEEDVAAWGDVIVNHTPYCVELDSKDEFGEFTEVYPDGSILSRSKDDGESRPINGGQLFALLLSKGFDLFGLIKKGLALDSDSKQ